MGPKIHFPTNEEVAAAKNDFITRMRQIKEERDEATIVAQPALLRLVEAMRAGGDQSYKLRSLLFSLWNGKPAPLIEILHFDWSIRKDLLAVMLAFGADDFFYNHIEQALTASGLFDWFTDESETEWIGGFGGWSQKQKAA